LPESNLQGCKYKKLNIFNGFLRCFCDADALLGLWIPAIPTGMTHIHLARFAKDPKTHKEPKQLMLQNGAR